VTNIIPFPVRKPSRLLDCHACGDRVEVFELPAPFLDPRTYVCGQCLMEKP